MSTNTKIEWTDTTWNPLRGCSRVSEGCRNCYAERQAIRQVNGAYAGLVHIANGHPSWTGKVSFVEDHLLDPLSWKKPRRVFVNSMSDLFHENVPDEWIDKIFAVMALCPQHTFQILTKRPQRMLEYIDAAELSKLQLRIARHADQLTHGMATREEWKTVSLRWPLRNVWLGVSVEDQKAANTRIPLLLKTPAAVRFISAEPLLGPVDLTEIKYRDEDVDCLWNSLTAYHEVLNSTSMDIVATADDGVTKLDWVIAGGESGPGSRTCDTDWIQSIVWECKLAGVPCFVKQVGSNVVQGGEVRRKKDRKGGDPHEWPHEMRVREFPPAREIG